MKDLYRRLGTFGFDQAFIRQFILPDWWDDELAANPTNRAVAEGAISRMLGFSLAELSDPKRSLSLPSFTALKLKKAKRLKSEKSLKELAPTILLAEQTAAALVSALRIPRFTGLMNVRVARDAVLAGRDFADLDALLEFAWSHGIAVIHLAHMPKGLRKVAGLAMFAGNVPVIVLGSTRDSTAWLAFHLAHELAHVLLGHVSVGSPVVADVSLDTVEDDAEERAADAYACELLSGIAKPTAKPRLGMTAEKLVIAARNQGSSHRADPGVVALMYGLHAERMGVAQNALKIMGLDRGAHEMIASKLTSFLRDDLADVTQRFVGLVATA